MGDDSTKKWSLLRKLKKAVNKVKFILSSSFRFDKWSLASIGILRGQATRGYSRHLSFGDATGLYNGCNSEDPPRNERGIGRKSFSSGRSFSRVRSIGLRNDGDDIDKRADLFIENFHKQLRMERQISLQLRYCSHNGS